MWRDAKYLAEYNEGHKLKQIKEKIENAAQHVELKLIKRLSLGLISVDKSALENVKEGAELVGAAGGAAMVGVGVYNTV